MAPKENIGARLGFSRTSHGSTISTVFGQSILVCPPTHHHTTVIEANSNSPTQTATGWDKFLGMDKGFNNTLINRMYKNKASEYEMILYQLAIEHDPHLGAKVRSLQLSWCANDRAPDTLERLRRANQRVNNGEKLPPWGPPLLKGDRAPHELRPCQCKLSRDKVPWNAPTFWEGASRELRDALAKRAVELDTPEAAITSEIPEPTPPSRQPNVPGPPSQELRDLVRAAAGPGDRRERCTKLMKERGSDEDICMSTFVPIRQDLIHLN
jgi:hypothetical protein